MLSEFLLTFLLTVLGLIMVVSLLFGGMILAGFCHELLTPDLDIFYVIWLWICGIPIWWLGVRTLATERIQHPVAAYLAFLPFLVLWQVLFSWLEPRNPLLIVGLAVITFAAYPTVAVWRKGSLHLPLDHQLLKQLVELSLDLDITLYR